MKTMNPLKEFYLMGNRSERDYETPNFQSQELQTLDLMQ